MVSIVTEGFSFYLRNFASQEPILILQGDATVSSEGKLRLTNVDEQGVPVYHSIGRALHIAPVHIWDRKTSNLASFFTCFSFTIHAPDVIKKADGLAFFLAPANDEPKDGGGCLGIFKEGEKGPVVAVEFDTFINTERDIDDPNYVHIGLDFMSIKSRKTVRWGFENDNEAYVFISYDISATNALKATLVYPSSGKSYSLSEKEVDLRDALHDWVRVGFSAASGKVEPEYVETHDVNSWYFASAFGEDVATLAEPLKTLNPDLAAYLDVHFGA